MFFPEVRVRVFLHGQPVDMRKSFDGLIALTRQGLGQDPLSGHVYVYVNRRGNQTPLRIPIAFGGDRVSMASIARQTGPVVQTDRAPWSGSGPRGSWP